MSQYGYPTQQPPPKRGMSTGKKVALGCGIPMVLGLLLVGGCTVLVGGAAHEIDKSVKADAKEDSRAAREDVKITDCRLVDKEFIGKTVETRVLVKNNGKGRANYIVEGEYLDSKGNKIGSLTAVVENLSPGTESRQNFGGALILPEDLKGVTKGECKIVKVTRDEWSAAN